MNRICRIISILSAVLLVYVSCKEAGNVAPAESRLFLSASPQEIGFNGTSVLTVTGTDENGAALPDGTEVGFSVVEAGRVEPSTVQLVNGSATTTYFATFVSGDITITATSGSVEASITIGVADNLNQQVFVSANPAILPAGGGTSLISAVVTDESGNTLEGIGVQFSTTQGTLQSAGAVITTNETGVATDTLNTSAEARVTATTDDGFSDETLVEVGEGRIVCHMSVSTRTPMVGQTVLFFDTSDVESGQTVRYHWDFDDGGSADGQNVEHIYRNEGTFNVIHSVIDERGNSTFCDPFPIEVSR